MMDTKLTTYRVTFTTINESNAGTAITQHVAIEEGYTTFADIPKILATYRGIDKSAIVILSTELLPTF